MLSISAQRLNPGCGKRQGARARSIDLSATADRSLTLRTVTYSAQNPALGSKPDVSKFHARPVNLYTSRESDLGALTKAAELQNCRTPIWNGRCPHLNKIQLKLVFGRAFEPAVTSKARKIGWASRLFWWPRWMQLNAVMASLFAQLSLLAYKSGYLT
jgi:hypothetical protein